MFSFWSKNIKRIFYFKTLLSLTKFATISLCECEQIGAPHRKTVKKMTFFKKRICYDFLKNRYFRKLTTEFENRTKRQADTKEYVFLDVDH